MLGQLGQTVRAHHPRRELQARRQGLTDFQRRLNDLAAHAAEKKREQFARVEAALRLLGPEATLRRGYSVTLNAQGEIIRSVRAVKAGQRIRTRVSDGEFDATAD